MSNSAVGSWLVVVVGVTANSLMREDQTRLDSTCSQNLGDLMVVDHRMIQHTSTFDLQAVLPSDYPSDRPDTLV